MPLQWAPFLQEQRLSRYKPITMSRSQISETKITGERRGGIERAREINTERKRRIKNDWLATSPHYTSQPSLPAVT